MEVLLEVQRCCMLVEVVGAIYSLVKCCRREIKELEKEVGHNLLPLRAPENLWDNCLELEVYIRSNTAHDIYKFNGEVPEIVISGGMLDITSFCK